MRKLLMIVLISLAVLESTNSATAGLFHRRSRCCCCCTTPALPQTAQTPQPVVQLFKSPKGHSYKWYLSEITPSSDADEAVEALQKRTMRLDRAMPLTDRAEESPTERILRSNRVGSTSQDDYEGNDRAAAKTTVSNANTEEFGSLRDLLASLPSDKSMREDHEPPLRKDADFGRVDEEQRNVTVEAWLYAAKHEDDNDFHLLLGNTDSVRTGTNMMTAEITGLPQNGFRDRLSKPRQAFKDYFNGEPPTQRYKVFTDPIHVRITGSLFYDVDHAAGVVGTGNYKPKTAWEIHPVTKIEFLED